MTMQRTSRRKIRDRPADIPPDDRHVSGWTPRLFQAADNSIFAQLANPVEHYERKEAVATTGDLNQAFIDYVMLSSLARKRNPPSKMLTWLNRVESDTMALLNTLGLSGDEWAKGETTHQTIKLLPALMHLRAGKVYGAGPFPFGVPTDLRRVFGEARFVEALRRAQQYAEQSGETLDPTDARHAWGSEAADALLPLAPRVLGLMVALARAIKANEPRRSRRGGRRPDAIRAMLFRQLALVHRDMFGDLPSTRDKLGRRIPDPPSLRWVRGVLNLATERLLQARDPLMTAGAGWVKGLANLSDARLIDLIEAGKAAANRRFRRN